MEKGILTKEMEVLISEMLDNLFVFDNKIIEAVDGKLFRIIISQIDDRFGEKIPEPYKSTLRDILITVFQEKDYQLAISIGVTFIDSQVDIPGIDDETELLIFKGLETILFAILAKLNTNG